MTSIFPDTMAFGVVPGDVQHHSRRVRLVLIWGAFLLLFSGIAWTAYFAAQADWLAGAFNLVAVALGAAVLVLVRLGRLRFAAWVILTGVLSYIVVTCVLLDLPTSENPRTMHLFFLPLAVGTHLLLQRETRWQRHGAVLGCLMLFGVFAAGFWDMPTGHELPEYARRVGTPLNSALAVAGLCLMLYIAQLENTERQVLLAELQEAVARDELCLYYQPQLDDHGRLVGAEALVRWPHPKRGMVSPGEFIPMAERSNMMGPLGDWVLRAACQQLALWSQDEATRHLSLAVNVSARQFQRRDFVGNVVYAARRAAAPTERLKIELTEGALAEDTQAVSARMTALRSHGIGISLDDFGTGFSSLNYLKRLPLDQIKIDQSFVRDLPGDASDAAIVQTILDLARTLNLQVVAEGVETDAQRAFLHERGCRCFQGYLFAKPMPAEDFQAYVQALKASS